MQRNRAWHGEIIPVAFHRKTTILRKVFLLEKYLNRKITYKKNGNYRCGKYWNHGEDPECLIQRAAEIGITIEEDVSDEKINKNISDLCQQLKEIHKKSKEYRDEMLNNLENFSADIDDKKRAH